MGPSSPDLRSPTDTNGDWLITLVAPGEGERMALVSAYVEYLLER